MAPHFSTLAWKIPWTEEPGGLHSMGSLRVRHDWATSLSLFTFMHWKRKWQPTAVFLPGESQGGRSLVDCRLWGRTQSDTTEATQQQQAYKDEIHSTYWLSFPRWLSGNESICQCRRLGSIPGLGRSPGGGNGNPLQYSWLENPMDRGAWQTTVHRVTKESDTT